MRTINYTVSYEKLLSRLPALFAYLDLDENGVCKIMNATQGEQGNYGKIVANIHYPGTAFNYTCEDGVVLKISAGDHSYRTLIDAYYKAYKDREWERADEDSADGKIKQGELKDINSSGDADFMRFMERGIGLKYLGLSSEPTGEKECGVDVTKTFPLAPDYVYLGAARPLYEEMVKLKKQIEFWEEHIESCKGDTKYYTRAKEIYELRNGDKLRIALGKMIVEAEDVANEYYNYAIQCNKRLSLNFNVNLTSKIRDLGMVTPAVEEWVAGKRYYDGDIVYHVDSNGYGMTWKCCLSYNVGDTLSPNEYQALSTANQNKCAEIVNGYYHKVTEYIIKEDIETDDFDRPYTEGYYDLTSEITYFDNGDELVYDTWSLTTPHNWVAQSLNWIQKYPNAVTDSGSTSTDIDGTANSHLTSLRRYDSYMTNDEYAEYPEGFEDWLWYYRKGKVHNREEKYDNNGNLGVLYGSTVINKWDDKGNTEGKWKSEGIEAIENNGSEIGSNIVFDGDDALNLAVWGDVITDITANNNYDSGIGTITFEYVLGVHLKAKKDVQEETEEWYYVDEDGNYKYYFKDFEPDFDSQYGKDSGVKYTETYYYYKGNTNFEFITNVMETEDSEVETTRADDDEEEEEQKVKYYAGYVITDSQYAALTSYSDDDDEEEKTYKENLKKYLYRVENTIWNLVTDGKFDDYINGKYDRDYIPDESVFMPDDSSLMDGYGDYDSDAIATFGQRYYMLYDKMAFDTSYNLQTYDFRINNRIKNIPYLGTKFTATADITHVNFQETPLIRYDFYNGVSFQPTVNDNVNIERGVTTAFEKHIKLGEIKTMEDLETYSNGGFFTLSKEDLDLG